MARHHRSAALHADIFAPCPPQSKLIITYQEVALARNGPFLVHVQLMGGQQLHSAAGLPAPMHAKGVGQTKNKGRQQASAALLHNLALVGGI